LRWARETAGLSTQDTAAKVGVRSGRVEEWEAGTTYPSIAQLKALADVTKRPLAAFFLAVPPAMPRSPHDFRSERRDRHLSPALRLEMRKARRRREVALQLAYELDVQPPRFELAAKISNDPEEVAELLRKALAVSIHDQLSWRSDKRALETWIGAVERLGALVFQTGDVPRDEMRGFSISEEVLPVIVLSGKDHPHGRIFTLMHELAHLILRSSGICDLSEGSARRTRSHGTEIFCNRVAGAVLVPRPALLEQRELKGVTSPREWSQDELRRLAARFSVSREVMARRLAHLQKATRAYYERMRRQFVAEYVKMRKRDKKQGGPAVHVMIARDNGKTYSILVLRGYDQGRIPAADVSEYLGTRLKHLPGIESQVGFTPVS
jgi:Zn-dependent peptidase ImmA (M78 family)